MTGFEPTVPFFGDSLHHHPNNLEGYVLSVLRPGPIQAKDEMNEKDLASERVSAYLKECQKRCPKGVSIKLAGSSQKRYLQLRFNIGTKQRSLACDCPMTMQGITAASEKAVLVSAALKSVTTEAEFLVWYDEVIIGKNVVRNNLMTFGDAIKKFEEEYWAAPDRKHRQRSRTSVSQQATYTNVYGRFFKLLPSDRLIQSKDLLEALDTLEEGTGCYGDCLYAFKRLAVVTGHGSVIAALDNIKHTQTKFRALQNAELTAILTWMKQCLEASSERYRLQRKRWLWVFSVQLIYGLRINEVFAIQNVNKPFKTKDGVTIPAVTQFGNKAMIVVVGEETVLGTTTKTGYRLVPPMVPPSHPSLVEDLDIATGELPKITSTSNNPLSVTSRISHAARKNLVKWKAPVTQTHALRHLCNQHGRQAGISTENRATNLGHSAQVNANTYLKREATATRLAAIDAMNARSILPFEGCLAAIRRIGVTTETVALIAEIYGLQSDDVVTALSSER
jgi:integrase